MRFGALVRGIGKIYLMIEDVDLGQGEIRCSSRVANGDAVPACAVRTRSASPQLVAVVPLLRVKQQVVVELVASDGAVVDSVEQAVKPFASAFESKWNSFSGKEGIELARNADLQPSSEEAWVHVDRIMANDHGEEFDIVQGRIQVFVAGEVEGQAKPEISLCDRSGRPVAFHDFIILDEGALSGTADGASSVRTLSFSVKKPPSPRSFFVGVAFPDCGLAGGFVYVDKDYAGCVRWEAYGAFNPGGDGSRYHDWFMEHHRASSQELAMQRLASAQAGPLFSIIVPLYETPLGYFREMVESVLAQTYARFELVLVNASPANAELCAEVDRYARADDRIVVVDLPSNEGITLNTNAGIAKATGDFLCFFDHDDVLEPDILFEYAKAIEACPETDLIYCDEDKLLDGRFVGGFFKPDFDFLLLMSSNYVCHMLTVRAELVRALEQLPGKEFDGSQDHNMTFVIAEQARAICHVPKVLYHWRMHEASTAANDDAKPWTLESGKLAVEQHLERIGVPAAASDMPGFPNCYAVDYCLPDDPPLVSLVVVADDPVKLERCLSALSERADYPNLEAIVAWRGSEGEAARVLERVGFPEGRITKWEEGSAAAAVNRAVKASDGSRVVIVGQEAQVVSRNWVARLIGPTLRDDVSACGPRLLYADGTVRQTGLFMAGGTPIRASEYVPQDSWASYTIARFARCVTALEMTFLAVSREDFEAVGGFDEDLDPLPASLDLCFKLQGKKGSVAVEPRVEVVFHPGGAVATSDWRAVGRQTGVLMARWPERFEGHDPHYNENLAPGGPSFALEIPRDSLSDGLRRLPC